ncbi:MULTISPECIES: hypothetical protein [unclassified Mesorhizobium]|uniref:hypothetical protein n=1 Tax=unclassified Mesorhizobium TaxID=325217 RepID=UPI0003CE741E|nr:MULTISPECIES: hypothetical protein [unclassified Mesorhizobium]ESY09653.1 hypothetical protein X751_31485 [Mesorhizobium sp. LNJC395A00]WJI76000.1 hypothetical protein NLY37_04605 [Mesorhizobium sp. C395A]
MVHIIPLSVAKRRRDADASPVSAAAQPLDSYWQEVAEHYERLMAQQQAFDTEIAARKLDGEIAKAEADAVANAPADGAGLHEGMYGQVDPHTGRVLQTGRFDTLFKGFLSQVPPELHPGLGARKETLRTEGAWRMAAQQLQRRKDYERTQVDTALQTNAIAIGKANPDDHLTFEAARRNGLDLIDKMGVDPDIRQQLAKDWYSTAAKARFEALISRDPKRALEIFGVGTPATGGEAAGDSARAEGGSSGGGPKMAPKKEGRGAQLARLPTDALLADLSPDAASELVRQAHAANAARLIDARTDIALAAQNAPDAIATTGVYSGRTPGPETFAAVYGVEEGGKQYGDFARRIDVGRLAFGMRTMPNQSIHAALRDAEPGPGRSNEEQAQYEVTVAAALKALNLRRADPAGYVREAFPNVDAAWSKATSPDNNSQSRDPKEYGRAIALSIAAQRQLGVEKPLPLPKSVVQSIIDAFRNNDMSQAAKDASLRDLLAAGPDPSIREALSQQLEESGFSRPNQVDPITTAATGQELPSSVHSDNPKSAFQQAAEDFGNYLSEGFESLGRAPHDIGLALQDLRDSPWSFLEQLPVTPGSGAVAEGRLALESLGQAAAKGLAIVRGGASKFSKPLEKFATSALRTASGLAPEGATGTRWGENLLRGKEIAAEVIEPALRAFSKNYRQTFLREYPELIDIVFVHHRIEQKVLKRYIGIISQEMMHSLENLRGIPKELNSTLHLSTIRREWDAFYRQNPTTTLKKLLEKATEIDQKYGHLFNPPIGK